MPDTTIKKESQSGESSSFLLNYRDHLLAELHEVERRLGQETESGREKLAAGFES